jgi:1-aminocyclopropane-1-carboxylate deaminase
MLKQQTTPLQAIKHPLFQDHKIRVFVKREDLNNKEIQGNKLYKLDLNLKEHLKYNKKFLLTFGGAYSNHIAATAAACQQLNIPVIAVIRGNELANNLHKWSHTLLNAKQLGMEFIFVSRADYRLKQSTQFIDKLLTDYASQLNPELKQQLQHALWHKQITLLPEGGSNDLAVQGFASLTAEIENQCANWTDLFCAVGTGATLAGLVANSRYQNQRTLHGVTVLNKADYLLPQIQEWISANQQYPALNAWQLHHDSHAGGYAKTDDELSHFVDTIWPQITAETVIQLDPIYTSKAFHCFWKKLKNQEIKRDSTVILLHSGGLQGSSKNA